MKKLRPSHFIIVGYLSIILIGTFLLLLPFSRKGKLEFIDALFTATSATCVTGLIVKDTQNFFTPFGKFVILTLIQIGGLGYVTIVFLIRGIMGKRVPYFLKLAALESFEKLNLSNVFNFFKKLFLTFLLIEFFGILYFSLFFVINKYSIPSSIGHATFHTISAFCNAGFSSFSENISRFVKNPFFYLPLSFLFILGGIGFIVIEEIYLKIFKKEKRKISYHSQVVIKTTIFLILIGWLFIFIAEYKNSLSNYSIIDKIFISFFHAVTPRTAGFNLLDLSNFYPFTLIFIIFLMMIGGSPGGTAGGMKTTVFAYFLAWVRSILKGEEEVVLRERFINKDEILRAFSIILFYISISLLALFLLLITEYRLYNLKGFLPILFEIYSALGTVGLSTGSINYKNLSLSYEFSIYGKIIIIILMFSGRAGILTLYSAFIKKKKLPYKYPEAECYLF
jgi:trk system potassium uptake protein TrkH